MRPLAQHTLVEFHGCDPERLKRPREVRALLRRAVLKGRGTIVKSVFHAFSPYGVSGVIVITESHVTVHTWPEHGYAAMDIFSCSPRLDHEAIVEYFKVEVGAGRVLTRAFARGPRVPVFQANLNMAASLPARKRR